VAINSITGNLAARS